MATQLASPPGPKGLPGLGVALKFGRDMYGYLPGLAREYGDVVSVPVPGRTMVLISHPDHIEEVLFAKNDRYWHAPAEMREALLPGQPPAIVVREGEDWKRARRVLNPRFSERSLAGVSELIGSAVSDGVEDWRRFADTGKPVELQDELGIVIMSALLRSMFTRRFSREHILTFVKQFGTHGEYAIRGLFTRIVLAGVPFGLGTKIPPHEVPWPHLAKRKANFADLLGQIDTLIAEHREHSGDASDLLALMLAARFDDGTGFTHEEIRSEAGGVLFAGFDTTAYALAWTIGLLAKNPEPLQKAYAEVDALGGGPIGYEQIPQLPYLRHCFDEAQRLQGAPINARVAKEDDVIGGYAIPAGTIVIHSPYGLHRDPRFWTDPDRFHPDRFATDHIGKYAFIPFGAGPRRCMGIRMAYIEGVLALANILQRYQFHVPPTWQPEHRFALATGLKSLPVTLSSR
ncbi:MULTISPECIES: cytochrome P450 [unclassified Mycolicibacterium]|uniref:cytochrome P450 n=1 Tax=unclassified Mycolicibacterium TaxID=2636767 RepID=UPI0013919F6B|nr:MULTISPECIES: cytochrome P450 [unclassified Mycolicibacterium]